MVGVLIIFHEANPDSGFFFDANVNLQGKNFSARGFILSHVLSSLTRSTSKYVIYHNVMTQLNKTNKKRLSVSLAKSVLGLSFLC